MIVALLGSVEDGFKNSDWRLHKSYEDTKCISSVAEAMLEQEGWNRNSVDGSWKKDTNL